MTTGLRTLFIALVSASCGALFFALIEEKFVVDPTYNHNDPTHNNIDQTSASLLQQKISELEQKNKSLAQEKELLQKQLSQTHATDVAGSGPPVQINPLNKSTTENPGRTTSVEYKNIKYVESFRNWVTDTIKNPDMRIEQEVKKRFDAESINTSWATEKEQKVMRLFSENPELQGTALKDVKCRSSICEIAISAADIDQANLQFDKTNKALQSLSQTISIISAPNLEKSVNNLYVTLDEEGFNFN